jgi:LDH2 family malate/lactate/ureidoglycolate dehydrogenase
MAWRLPPPNLAALDAGSMSRKGDPVVVSDRGGAMCWDGRRLPGPWLVVRALEQALARVPEHRVAAVAVRESHHIGCQGCMILLTCSDPSEASVAPYGGVQALFTPDPIAVGIPTHGDPILIDMSASITTNGMTARLHRERRRFSGNWAITASGEPTDDPDVLFAEPRATLLPTGGREYGHKGYNLALMIEALSQELAGHGRADRQTGWGASVYVQVMDPAAFGGADHFVRQIGFIAAACRSNPPAAASEAVRLPGERGTPAPGPHGWPRSLSRDHGCTGAVGRAVRGRPARPRID